MNLTHLEKEFDNLKSSIIFFTHSKNNYSNDKEFLDRLRLYTRHYLTEINLITEAYLRKEFNDEN